MGTPARRARDAFVSRPNSRISLRSWPSQARNEGLRRFLWRASGRIEVRAAEVLPLWSVAGWRARHERARELSTKTGERATALAGAVVRQAHHERMRGGSPRTDEGAQHEPMRGAHHERARELSTKIRRCRRGFVCSRPPPSGDAPTAQAESSAGPCGSRTPHWEGGSRCSRPLGRSTGWGGPRSECRHSRRGATSL